MNYAFARQVVPLDSSRREHPLAIELYPAFAHLRGSDTWRARVRVSYVADRPLAVQRQQVRVPPGSAMPVTLPAPPPGMVLPGGFAPLVRIAADAGDGTVAVRQATR
jgi:hypothetical protein